MGVIKPCGITRQHVNRGFINFFLKKKKNNKVVLLVEYQVLKMGWKSPSRGSLSGWLMKSYVRSWKITKWMVDEVHAYRTFEF